MTNMNVRHPWGRDGSGVWHLTTATYPQSMDTACGLVDRLAFFFASSEPKYPSAEKCDSCARMAAEWASDREGDK